MMTKFNQLILLTFFALLTFTACQNEETQVINPSEQETIVPSSSLASLMSNATANYGAYDDVLDNASCFSIELPVTIEVSGITIVIESIEDLEELEDLLEELGDNEDILDFIFPITIIFNDYTEIVIENEEQFEDFIEDCEDEVEDDVIECIDFVYPISFSIFNAEFDIIDTISIDSDEELYNFLEELEEDDNVLIVSLNYPITLEYANGETIEVNSNDELAEAIEAAEDDCDDDDEEYECNEDNIAELLVECPWDIDDEYNDFDNYQIIFNEDGSLEITEGDATSAIGGNWELTDTDDGLKLILSDLTAFEQDLGGIWVVTECDDDELIIERGDFTLELDQDCDDDEVDCSVAEINAGIVECPWLLETNLIDTTVSVYVYFTPDGQILNANADGTETAIGTWDLTVTGAYIYFELEFETEYETLNGLWKVVECEDGELYLINDDNYIYLDQDCEADNSPFECFDDFEIEECANPNGVVEFNLVANTIGLIDCPFSFEATFHETEADAEAGVAPIDNTESYIADTGEVYLRIESSNGNFEVYTIYLYVEDCNPFECFESFDAVIEVCDDGTDGPNIYDLTIAFANCTPSVDVVSYHETQSDAANGVNAIADPTAYAYAGVETTVYIRVESENQLGIFQIHLVELDCNPNDCTEGDVDGILAECSWVPVSYNGDDNLINWVLNFEANSQVVVMSNGETTVTAVYTTSGSEDGVIVTFENVTGPEIQALSGSWLVVECSAEVLQLQNGDINIVLERTCD